MKRVLCDCAKKVKNSSIVGRKADLSLPRSATPSSSIRRFHPAVLGWGATKLLVTKKIGFWGGFQAANVYGWPRIARQLLKFNKKHTPPKSQAQVQTGILRAIRTPVEAYSVLQQSEIYHFLQKVSDQGASHVPAWVQSLASSIAGKSNVYKALKELENESKRLDALKRKKAREEANEKVKEELEELKARVDILAAEKAKAEAALHDTLNRLAQANSEVEQRK